MRVRARLTTAAAGSATALALVASLSGCMTVRGEDAVVPAATEEEAQRVLDHYVETSNEAISTLDAELNATVENGPLGAIREAILITTAETNPGSAGEAEPLELSDTQFHIPQQAGWPKYFVANTGSNQTPGQRMLLVFTRHSIDEDWLASYLMTLPTEDTPVLAEDEDGYLDDLPVGEDTNTGLAVEPGAVGPEFIAYLDNGDGPFWSGPYTSEIVAAREAANEDPAFVTEFVDQIPEEREFAPVAMRTQDGGALVLFTSEHHEKQTMAEGVTPTVDPQLEALMTGEATRSVTLERLAAHLAMVPQDDAAQIEILYRSASVVAATGE
jgi:hypothetical protein